MIGRPEAPFFRPGDDLFGFRWLARAEIPEFQFRPGKLQTICVCASCRRRCWRRLSGRRLTRCNVFRTRSRPRAAPKQARHKVAPRRPRAAKKCYRCQLATSDYSAFLLSPMFVCSIYLRPFIHSSVRSLASRLACSFIDSFFAELSICSGHSICRGAAAGPQLQAPINKLAGKHTGGPINMSVNRRRSSSHVRPLARDASQLIRRRRRRPDGGAASAPSPLPSPQPVQPTSTTTNKGAWRPYERARPLHKHNVEILFRSRASSAAPRRASSPPEATKFRCLERPARCRPARRFASSSYEPHSELRAELRAQSSRYSATCAPQNGPKRRAQFA